MSTKGQLISKCLYEVIVWTKIPTKNLIISALKGPGQKLSKFSLVFWSKRWFHKDVLKLTDLYLSAILINVSPLRPLSVVNVVYGLPHIPIILRYCWWSILGNMTWRHWLVTSRLISFYGQIFLVNINFSLWSLIRPFKYLVSRLSMKAIYWFWRLGTLWE